MTDRRVALGLHSVPDFPCDIISVGVVSREFRGDVVVDLAHASLVAVDDDGMVVVSAVEFENCGLIAVDVAVIISCWAIRGACEVEAS